MTGIVYAWSHLIGQQAAVLLEEFYGEYAYILQLVEDAVGGFFRGVLDCGIESRRGSERETQDAAAMVILD